MLTHSVRRMRKWNGCALDQVAHELFHGLPVPSSIQERSLHLAKLRLWYASIMLTWCAAMFWRRHRGQRVSSLRAPVLHPALGQDCFTLPPAYLIALCQLGPALLFKQLAKFQPRDLILPELIIELILRHFAPHSFRTEAGHIAILGKERLPARRPAAHRPWRQWKHKQLSPLPPWLRWCGRSASRASSSPTLLPARRFGSIGRWRGWCWPGCNKRWGTRRGVWTI